MEINYMWPRPLSFRRNASVVDPPHAHTLASAGPDMFPGEEGRDRIGVEHAQWGRLDRLFGHAHETLVFERSNWRGKSANGSLPKYVL